MKLRNPLARITGGTCRFGVRTRLARAAGADGRYKLGAVRVLPTGKPDTVVLQATDGKQAVCVLTAGQTDKTRLVPARVLPTRKCGKAVTIELDGDHWRAEDGAAEPDTYHEEGSYPPIADVLPKLEPGPNKPPVQLGVDLTLLNKLADGLGTSKLTLLIPDTGNTPTGNGKSGDFVNKPIAVCPATDEGKVRGVGVLMPLNPVNGVTFYAKVRKLVAEAERIAKSAGSPKRNRPSPARREPSA